MGLTYIVHRAMLCMYLPLFVTLHTITNQNRSKNFDKRVKIIIEEDNKQYS